jgi:hypothetical protein
MSDSYSNFVVLKTFSYLPEAHILKGALQAEGIESVLLGENIIDLIPVNNTLIGGIRLMVHKDDFEQAIEIMTANSSDESAQE